MIITVTNKGLKVGEQLEQKIRTKLEKFHRFFDDGTLCNVKLTTVRDLIRVELTLKIDRHYYRAEVMAGEAIAALEQAIDIMEGQIRKHKAKIKRQTREFSYLKEYLIAQPEVLDAEAQSEVIRKKSFVLTPMGVDEAVVQLEMLGHAFHVFLDAETNKICVLYKRNDGNYGIIEPNC